MHELKAKSCKKDVKGANPSPKENSDILLTFILYYCFHSLFSLIVFLHSECYFLLKLDPFSSFSFESF